jgi:hypothetical protein
MDTRGVVPRLVTMGEMANILLAARGNLPLSTIGKN